MARYNTICPAIFSTFLVFLSSCATVLNQPVQKIFITTDRNCKVISVEKTVATDSSLVGVNAAKTYYVVRSNNPLIVNLQIDSATKTILLKPQNSFAYWFNIYGNWGLGMLVDKDNSKRYAYPKQNYFEIKDTSVHRYRFAPIPKGTLNLAISLPLLNIFSIQTIDKQYNSGGIFGLQAGLEYFYTTNHYLSVDIGAATDRLPVDYFGPGYIQTGSTLFAGVRNNDVIGSFDLGYGLNVSRLKWSKVRIGDTTNSGQSRKNLNLGLGLSAQYRLGKRFHLGVLYQPSLLNLNSTPLVKYQHYFSFNLVWKLPVKKVAK